jgi:hypothetical protein
MKKVIGADEHIALRIEKSQAHFKRIKNSDGPDVCIGSYFLLIDVIAQKGDVLIPLSIASSKKAAGFMYQIEGTGTSSLGTAEVKAQGATTITLGTLRFIKIGAGKTAQFRVQVEIKGKLGKEYTVVIHQINYKLNATDARYKKFTGGVSSKTLEFR